MITQRVNAGQNDPYRIALIRLQSFCMCMLWLKVSIQLSKNRAGPPEHIRQTCGHISAPVQS